MASKSGTAWWDAMRRARTLGEFASSKDDELEEVVSRSLGIGSFSLTPSDLDRYCFLRRNGEDLIREVEGRLGMTPGTAKAKDFARYYEVCKGLSDVARTVPTHHRGEEFVAEYPRVDPRGVLEKEGREALMDLKGGFVGWTECLDLWSVVPEYERGRAALRAVQRLPEAASKTNPKIFEEVRAALGLEGRPSVRDLERYFEHRRANEFGSVAKVPGELSWSETVAEIAKALRIGRGEAERRSGAKTVGELRPFLDELGGPSSSEPDEVPVPDLLAELRRRGRLEGADGWNESRDEILSRYDQREGRKRRNPEHYPTDEVHETRARRRADLMAFTMAGAGRTARPGRFLESFPSLEKDLRWDELNRGEDGRRARQGLDYLRNPEVDGPGAFGGAPLGEPKTWWDSLRRLRTVPEYADLHDYDIVRAAEWGSGAEPGEATKESLDLLWEVERGRFGAPAAATAHVPVVLTRSETLAELAKFERFEGASKKEIENLVGGERVPTTKELKGLLFSLGGPSSSSPERSFGQEDARRALGRTEGLRWRRFQNPDRLLTAAWGVERIARLPPSPEASRVGARDFLDTLRDKYPGLDDAETVEEEEGAGGPLSLEAPGRMDGGRGDRWHEAVAKVQSLRGAKDLVDFVEEEQEARAATDADLLKYYDSWKHLGAGSSWEGMPFTPTRKELVALIGARGRSEEQAPREGPVATYEELEDFLDLLGGPPGVPTPQSGGWWDALRNLRKIPSFQGLVDEDIVARAKKGPAPVRVSDLEDLFARMRSREPLTKHARVPRELSRRELLTELRKFPEWDGDEGADLKEALDLLGGPSSSNP